MLELSLHILDILQNSLEAGATRLELKITEDPAGDCLRIALADNGKGMSQEMVRKVLDPFVTTRTTRRVGLGLPMLAAAARQCDGDLEISSALGKGTRLEATFKRSHWDRAPLGNIPATLVTFLLSGSGVDLSYEHVVGERSFQFDTAEVRRELGDLPLSHPQVRQWMLETLNEGEASLREKAAAGRPTNRSV